ncbi:RNA ligase [Arthrobacter phage Salgado]|uniref:RNA ligase n=1 Tax=Arthrobacter phage Salgado TaxID=1772314 RepID=A0A0U4INK6_9CAUD|nr:RNA ligase [Arthrobacter phage Salgado]ALY10186.1 RNA ligase [Arthrobacter phage Salgado]
MTTRKITLPKDEAIAFAKSIREDYTWDEVEAVGAAVLEVTAALLDDGTYDVTVAPPTGVMVGWFLDDWTASKIALPGGEPMQDLHVTLAYLGDASAMTLDDQRKLIGVVSEVTNRHGSITGALNGIGRFSAPEGADVEPLWVGVNLPGLQALRADLVEALQASKLPVSTEFDFHPHITVAYIPKEQETPKVTVDPYEIRLGALTVAIAGARHLMPLVDEESMPHADQYIGAAYRPDLTKAVGTMDEERFTLGPWYVPNQLDAHGEWTDPGEIQKALWGYVENADREIRLQHNVDIRAGRWVEAMTWPFEVEVPLTKADGTVMNYKYPAGTPFLGVIWDEWAWDLVKAGKLRGYSIGGTSERLEVDLPGAPKTD